MEVNYLRPDAGKAWRELDQDRQSSLMAYWLMKHQGAREAAPEPPAPRAPPPGPRVVRSDGNPVTEAQASMVRAAAESMLVQRWARKTGADPDVIRRFLAKG